MPDEAFESGKSIVEVFRLIVVPKYSLIIWVSGLTLFCIPDLPALHPFLAEFREKFGVFVAPLIVLAFIAWCIGVFGAAIKRWLEHRKLKHTIHRRFLDMSTQEATWFADRLRTNTRGSNVERYDADVPPLVKAGILDKYSTAEGLEIVVVSDIAWDILKNFQEQLFRKHGLRSVIESETNQVKAKADPKKNRYGS